MGSLIRRNLDHLLDDPLRGMDDLFRGFFVRPVDLEGGSRLDIDLREDDKAYTVHANLPGVNKEDIKVEIDGNLVRIEAETRQEKEEKEGERVIRSERYVGKVARSFRLETEVDDATAVAKFENGVLELTLPKRVAASTHHRLTIQ